MCQCIKIVIHSYENEEIRMVYSEYLISRELRRLVYMNEFLSVESKKIKTFF